MNKLLYAFIAMLFVGCDKNDIENSIDTHDTTKKYIIGVSYNDTQSTRATLTNTGVFNWAEDSKMFATVAGKGNSNPFTLTKGAGTKYAEFSGTLNPTREDGNPLCLLYAPVEKFFVGNAKTHTLVQPATQNIYYTKDGNIGAASTGKNICLWGKSIFNEADIVETNGYNLIEDIELQPLSTNLQFTVEGLDVADPLESIEVSANIAENIVLDYSAYRSVLGSNVDQTMKIVFKGTENLKSDATTQIFNVSILSQTLNKGSKWKFKGIAKSGKGWEGQLTLNSNLELAAGSIVKVGKNIILTEFVPPYIPPVPDNVMFVKGTGGANGSGDARGYMRYSTTLDAEFSLNQQGQSFKIGTNQFVTYKDAVYVKTQNSKIQKYTINKTTNKLVKDSQMQSGTAYKIFFESETVAYWTKGGSDFFQFNPSTMVATGDKITVKDRIRDAVIRDGKLFAIMGGVGGYSAPSLRGKVEVDVVDLATKTVEKTIVMNDCNFGGDEYGHNNGVIIDENNDIYILTVGDYSIYGSRFDAKVLRIKSGETEFDLSYSLNIGQLSGLNNGSTSCARGFAYSLNGKAYTAVVDRNVNNFSGYYRSAFRWCEVDLYNKSVRVLENIPLTAGHKGCAVEYNGVNAVYMGVYADGTVMKDPTSFIYGVSTEKGNTFLQSTINNDDNSYIEVIRCLQIK